MQTPRIFEAGVFIEPDAKTVEQLDEPTRARLDKVRAAYNGLLDAQEAESAAMNAAARAVKVHADAQDYIKRNFLAANFHDEWITNFGNEDQRRDLAQRRARR